MSKAKMCQGTDSDEVAETDFCLHPDDHLWTGIPNEIPNGRLAEEGECKITRARGESKVTRILGEDKAGREWVKFKKYVEDGEDDKVGAWLDKGIQEVKTEQEGINGYHGKPNTLLRAKNLSFEINEVYEAKSTQVLFQVPTDGSP